MRGAGGGSMCEQLGKCTTGDLGWCLLIDPCMGDVHDMEYLFTECLAR